MIRVRSLFLRSLGVIYLIAFLSLWVQLSGLIGSHGILPARDLMALARIRIPGRFDLLPTLAWLNADDWFLHLLCGGGTLFSLFLIFGIFPSVVLFLLWFFYLSLVVVGGDFLSFQWDNLLLETGFVSIFFGLFKAGAPSGPHQADLRWPPNPRARTWPSQIARFSLSLSGERTALWLLRLLLFKLMFESGCVKLLSGDPHWRDLTALNFHYETQPLPTWIGWYAYQLPAWFQRFSVGVMFFIELAVPFTVFAPRRLRLIGCGILIFFQILIFLTGNYCFFNLLTVLLCLILLDDEFLKKVLPPLCKGRLGGVDVESTSPDPSLQRRGIKYLSILMASVIIFVSTLQFAGLFLGRRNLPPLLRQALRICAPFRTINNYGLFAVMTTNRREIVIEGSDDGQNWKAYEFKYKPGGLKWRPRFVEPHQPRLDWQMWFAALEDCHRAGWFQSFMERIQEGSPTVLNLLKSNPFPDKPPRYLRAVAFDYHLTDWATKRAAGTWWRREFQGLYCPVLKKSS